MTAHDPLLSALAQELQATQRHAGQLARVTAIVRVLLPYIVEVLDEGGTGQIVVRLEGGRVIRPLTKSVDVDPHEVKKAG